MHKFPFGSVISFAIMWKMYWNYLQTSLSWLHAFKSEQTFCREENFVGDIEVNFPGWSSFSFSTKMKRSILLNITFLSASSNSTLVILLREKKTIYCLHGRWFLFMRKKSSCINYSVNTMTSCTRNLARAPYPQLSDGEYRGRIVRHRRLKTEPMLLRGLYNSLHHTQPHSVIVK